MLVFWCENCALRLLICSLTQEIKLVEVFFIFVFLFFFQRHLGFSPEMAKGIEKN